MKILVGSKNPVKIDSVKEAFSLYFGKVEVFGVDVSSQVSDQPINNETFEGAKNRANTLKEVNQKNSLGAEYFVGVEGGIVKLYNKWFAFGCMCIIDTEENIGYGLSPMFELPVEVTKELLAGKELGLVMDEIMNAQNTKQKGGAISYFTEGVMSRKELYVEGLKVAVVPFLHKRMYFKK